jgi:hypothetical protein
MTLSEHVGVLGWSWESKQHETYQDWLGGTTKGTGVGVTAAEAVAAKLPGKPRSCNTMKADKALQESILAKIEKRMIQRSTNILVGSGVGALRGAGRGLSPPDIFILP